MLNNYFEQQALLSFPLLEEFFLLEMEKMYIYVTLFYISVYTILYYLNILLPSLQVRFNPSCQSSSKCGLTTSVLVKKEWLQIVMKQNSKSTNKIFG